MKKNICVVSVILIALLVCSCKSNNLVILHTNDTHSQIEQVRVGYGAGKGGVVRRGVYFDKVRSENDNVLILDAGDYNQGTPYFTVYKGDLEMELMNSLGYDVVTLGNHEFDNGMEELARRLSKAKFTTVCANADFTGTPLEGIVKPYTIVKKGGRKIGILGVIPNLKTLVAANSIKGMKLLDPYEEVNKVADMLKNEKKCDLVIALTHIGYSDDSPDLSDIKLAKRSRNVDLIIGGHSHSFLKEESVFKNLDGKDVPVAHAGAQGEYVGRFDIHFED